MGAIDITTLLLAVNDDDPAGEDLEYDPQFNELERAAQGKEGQSIGDSVIESEPPDWKLVQELAIELLGKSKDLRLATYLTRALLNLHGIGGFADGLSLLRQMLEQHWDYVHPQLDPDDDNDPTFRVNTLITLCDRLATLSTLENTPLVSSKMLGQFSLYDIHVANGERPAPEDDDPPTPASIEAAFMDADLESLEFTAEALQSCQDSLSGIDMLLMEKIGSSQAPDMSALEKMLRECQAAVNERVSTRGGAAEETPEQSDTTAEEGTSSLVKGKAASGEILSREDATRYMDKIAQYFERNEPSSPVPLMMHRAKRLATMSFMDILKEMAPGGLGEAEHITGHRDDG